MKIAYFDCFSGASGDMILGALLDAGLELDTLRTELAGMDLDHYSVGAEKVVKKGMGGTQALIDCEQKHHGHDHDHHHSREHGHDGHDHDHRHSREHGHDGHDHDHHHSHEHGHDGHDHDHHHSHEHGHNGHDHDHHHGHEHHEHERTHAHKHNRNLHDIETIINSSSLSGAVKQKSIRIFNRLAEAEAKVHRTAIDNIHFHEVGAMDAIIDIVGAVIGLDALGIERVYCSPLHVGSGVVECAHGTLPVPAPATLELIKGKPIYSTGVKGELLTPTGAAILTTLAHEFGPMPAMTVETVGYGAGTSEPAIPNLLRVAVGNMPDIPDGYEMERMAVIETSIDDMDPRIYDSLIENMLKNGAMDVFLLPIQMKKNRPGTLVTVLCAPELVWKMSDILIRETTTIGLRWRVDERIKAGRKIEEIDTVHGKVRIKVARVGEKTVNISAEYDDCKRIAREKNIPLKEVMEQTIVAIKGREK